MKTRTLTLGLLAALCLSIGLPAAGQPARKTNARGMNLPEQVLATFCFVVNKGPVYSVNGLGELTSLTLSGYRTDALTDAPEKGTMNGTLNTNKITLTGVTSLNPYNPEPSAETTASLRLLPLSAPTGLSLSLTIDGTPCSVELPYVSNDFTWKAGYTYRYVITMNSGMLQITGMSVEPTL